MAGPRLRIVAVNDVYTLENLPRLATLIATLAARDPVDRTLITLAGDFLAPSLLSSLDQGRGMVDVMNALAFTHVTFGNHEDDLPPDELCARMRELRATWLATNLPDFAASLTRLDDVVTVTGTRTITVGLIGVVDDDPCLYPRPPFGGTRVLPPLASAIAASERLLRDNGVTCVIALTHLAVAHDRELAAAMHPPFPLILGGHDHQPFLEQVGATWLGKAGSDAVAALVVELRWPEVAPADADRPTVDMRLEPVAHYPEDAAVRALVDHHMRPVRALQAAALMRIPPGVTLSSVGARAGQTTLGTLVCSNMRDVMKADVAVFNGGGIRGAHVYERLFTYADLEAELPFDNALVVADLPGRVLSDAIAWSRRLAPADSGGFLQVDAGVVMDGEHIATIAGQPLDRARTYRVALVRDMLLGMDDNHPLVEFAHAHPDQIPPTTAGREVKEVLVDAFGACLARELGMDAIDTNHDGVLSVAEIAQAIARAPPTGSAPTRRT